MVIKSTIFAILAIAVLGVELFPQNQFALTERKDLLRELCKRNGGEDKYEDVKNAATKFKECVNSHIDEDSIKAQFRDALANNSFNAEFFTQYCSKIPQLKSCVNAFVDSVAPCTDEPMRNYFTAAINTENELMDFVCNDNGEKLSQFINEGGLKCFRGYEIVICASNYLLLMARNLETFNYSAPDFCTNVDQFHSCMGPELRKCQTMTASNLFDSFVSITQKNFSCNESKTS